MQCKQSGAYDPLDVRPMKFEVELEGTDMVAARSGGDAELAIDLTHLAHDRSAAIDGQRRRLTGSESLEMPNDAQELAAVVLGERGNDQSLIAADARRGHEAFLLRAMQGTAHWRSAQSHAVDHGALGDASARRELPGDNQRAELVVDAGDVIRAPVAGRGA